MNDAHLSGRICFLKEPDSDSKICFRVSSFQAYFEASSEDFGGFDLGDDVRFEIDEKDIPRLSNNHCLIRSVSNIHSTAQRSY